MTIPTQENPTQEQQKNTKEDNLVQMRQYYERKLKEMEAAKAEAERLALEASKHIPQNNTVEDDEDDEVYIDKRKLQKHLSRFGEQTQKQTQSEIQKAVSQALAEERKQNWIKQNPDFYDVLERHAEEFASKDPELAETILSMPNTFERQKLVYRNIKTMGLHMPKQQEPSIQQKIDQNRKGLFYQPSGIGTGPYNTSSDFTPQGQKDAYQKMQDLKNRLRLG